MAETIYTKDGKCHTLLGSITPVSIIRDNCGDAVVKTLLRDVSMICNDIEGIADLSDMDIEDIREIKTCTEALKAIFE